MGSTVKEKNLLQILVLGGKNTIRRKLFPFVKMAEKMKVILAVVFNVLSILFAGIHSGYFISKLRRLMKQLYKKAIGTRSYEYFIS